MTTPTAPRSHHPQISAAPATQDVIDQRELQAAWTPGEPSPEAWTPRPWVTVDQRVAAGRAARQNAPRSSHGALDLPPGRDPIAILAAQEADRLPELVPLRHARMAESAFAYYRGTPAVMAGDLSTTPRSGIIVQASGDAHLSNFGLFASPERQLVFDANDFDETLPGPWEWDVKRLAASMLIAARSNEFTAAEGRGTVLATVRAYREAQARFAGMRLLEIWYDRTTSDSIEAEMTSATRTMKGVDAKQARARVDAMFA